MNHYMLLIVVMTVTIQVKMYTCTPTGVFYVLPDHSTNADCPSQPCVILRRYLFNNNVNKSLLFLSGKHTLTFSITMENAHNVTMIGVDFNNSEPAKIFCNLGKPAIIAVNSSNIKIANLVFENCGGHFVPQLEYDVDTLVIATAFLSTCYCCNVTNVKFIGYGLAAHNSLGESHISNIVIHLCETSHSLSYWIHKGIHIVSYGRSSHNVTHNLIYVSRISITIDNGINSAYMYDSYVIVGIHIDFQTDGYNTTLILSNSNFHYINNVRAVLIISLVYIERSRVALWIKNCEFSYNEDSRLLIDTYISYDKIFTNCLFYMNQLDNMLPLISIQVQNDPMYVNSADWCLFPSYIGIKNSSFIENFYPILKIQGNRYSKCVTRFSIIGPFITKENAGMTGDLISIHNAFVNVIGEATFTYNSNALNILVFYSCNVTFSKRISFIRNGIADPYSVDSIITLESDSAYIKVMENSNIRFIDNNYAKQLVQIKVKDYTPYPLCMFQYDTDASKNASYSLMKNYSISFYGGHKLPSNYTISDEVDSPVIFSVNYYTFHCKWLQNTIFYGSDYHPKDINKQIIQTDDNNMYQHTRVCYCFMNNTYDCSLDLLGPVFPGQVLQVDLCVPNEPDNDEIIILYVDTHNTFLPRSACKVTNQNQLVNTITNSPRTYNFTIVSDSTTECELFLTAQPDLYKRYDAFYVQLLPCPIGFTLQDGVCDCDHVLSTIIDKCYIEYSTIRRPVNSWIFAHTQADDIKYLVSSCPMDYCLPYSSNLNLLYPDLQCQFNRGGILCSQCPRPLSMVFGSSRCMKCTNVHILITIIVIVAGIVLVVLLYILNLTVTNGTINGIIFYANIVSINDSVFLVNDNVFKPLRVFISFTNLDLGIETCFLMGWIAMLRCGYNYSFLLTS